MVIIALPPGADANEWSPPAADRDQLLSATLYFGLGLPMDDRIARLFDEADSPPRLVDATAGFPLRPLPGYEQPPPDRSDGSPEETTNLPIPRDPYFWIGFAGARHITRTIATELIALQPERAAELLRRMDSALTSINELEEELSPLLEPYTDSTVAVSQPVFGYLLDTFGIRQVVDTARISTPFDPWNDDWEPMIRNAVASIEAAVDLPVPTEESP